MSSKLDVVKTVDSSVTHKAKHTTKHMNDGAMFLTTRQHGIDVISILNLYYRVALILISEKWQARGMRLEIC